MQIDKNLTYRTRDGRQARVYSVDGGGIYIVHGAWFCESNGWCPAMWTATGQVWTATGQNDRDLIEVRPRIVMTRWVNIYRINGELRGHWNHGSQSEADSAAGDGRIACVKTVVDCEEGEGLLNGR